MQIIRDLCERIKAFFIRKPVVSLINDESKIIDENTDDLEFHIPTKGLDLEDSPLPVKEEQILSLPAQKPTALELLAQQRSVCMAMDTNKQHLDENKPEGKQDVVVLSLEPKA